VGPVVSAAAAEAMAIGVRELLGSDIGLSVTGVAGPEEQDGQPVGTVFVGLSIGETLEHAALRLPGDRPECARTQRSVPSTCCAARWTGHRDCRARIISS